MLTLINQTSSKIQQENEAGRQPDEASANSTAASSSQRSISDVLDLATKADIAWEFQEAVTEILTAKSMSALRETGLDNLVVSGGVGANTRLRERLNAATKRKLCKVSYPRLEFCTDNGAMIAFAGAMRLQAMRSEQTDSGLQQSYSVSVKPRWNLAELRKP